ncbi:hypothetical protein CTAM01_07971 [Colletotrichum tamarilloi]|uniref:Uncharacterized protein n=1 Tax=Colletotrichum tamarilloi TaxID=1209934 RepID=A0ABQ9R7R9_9PEZI|nr:uncharacterized protein CTAM01_07971 [Colletotrichum tamarilloi]KAK1497307.1 hypothetical protein CTAM01_07971 [Colletotrichum tamarilloi]
MFASRLAGSRLPCTPCPPGTTFTIPTFEENSEYLIDDDVTRMKRWGRQALRRSQQDASRKRGRANGGVRTERAENGEADTSSASAT